MQNLLVITTMISSLVSSATADFRLVEGVNRAGTLQAAVVSYQLTTGDAEKPSVRTLVAAGYLNKSFLSVR